MTIIYFFNMNIKRLCTDTQLSPKAGWDGLHFIHNLQWISSIENERMNERMNELTQTFHKMIKRFKAFSE